MRMIVVMIIAAAPSMPVISQDIDIQHSLNLMDYRLTAPEIVDKEITTIEPDVQKVETAAKEPQVDTIKPYLPAQLGPNS